MTPMTSALALLGLSAQQAAKTLPPLGEDQTVTAPLFARFLGEAGEEVAGELVLEAGEVRPREWSADPDMAAQLPGHIVPAQGVPTPPVKLAVPITVEMRAVGPSAPDAQGIVSDLFTELRGSLSKTPEAAVIVPTPDVERLIPLKVTTRAEAGSESAGIFVPSDSNGAQGAVDERGKIAPATANAAGQTGEVGIDPDRPDACSAQGSMSERVNPQGNAAQQIDGPSGYRVDHSARSEDLVTALPRRAENAEHMLLKRGSSMAQGVEPSAKPVGDTPITAAVVPRDDASKDTQAMGKVRAADLAGSAVRVDWPVEPRAGPQTIGQPVVPSEQPTPTTRSAEPLKLDAALSETEALVLSGGMPPPAAPDVDPRAVQSGAAPSVARAVVAQLAVTVQTLASGATEIALNPEELGKVRLQMTHQDQGITVSIIAERPETMDLIRRNLDALIDELRAQGYGDVSFDFGDRKGSHPNAQDAQPRGAQQRDASPEFVTPPPLRSYATSALTGVDIRL